jgi:hypothetical protein
VIGAVVSPAKPKVHGLRVLAFVALVDAVDDHGVRVAQGEVTQNRPRGEGDGRIAPARIDHQDDVDVAVLQRGYDDVPRGP